MKSIVIVLPYILCAVSLVLAVMLPIIFRRKYWVRLLSVLFLFFIIFAHVHFGLRRAARNVDLPDHTTLKENVVYGDAWQEGRMATQRKVDAYEVPIMLVVLAIAILAVYPNRLKRHSSG